MAQFIKSAQTQDQYPVDKQLEICFIGRSNVGKSSLINALAKQKIARTSNTPGRTQLVNFFDFKLFRLVDLPGYGFAKVSKEKHQQLACIIDQYLGYRTNLCAVFQICDISVITNDDIEMSRYFENQSNYLHFIVLNKIDKTNKSYFDNNKHKIAKSLNISVDRLLYCSTKNSTNIDLIFAIIKKVITDKKQEIQQNKVNKKQQDQQGDENV